MKLIRIMLCLMLGGCGVGPSETRLEGTWQVDVPSRQKVVFTFQKDHTYTLALAGRPGALEGTWSLDGRILTMSMGSFGAYGVTNALPAFEGISTQKNAIVKLTDSALVWRDRAQKELKLKRVKSPPTGLPPVPRP